MLVRALSRHSEASEFSTIDKIQTADLGIQLSHLTTEGPGANFVRKPEQKMGSVAHQEKLGSLKVLPISDIEVSPETINEDSVPASPTQFNQNAQLLMSDDIKKKRKVKPMNSEELQAMELALQASEVQLEESIQPAGRIDNIKKNKHQKMMSGTTADLNAGAPQAVATGKKLSLRLSNLRSFALATFQDPQNLTHIDLRNNRLAQLPDQLCDLVKLVELKLDYNFLLSLPHSINKLENLELLSASQNSLKAIPSNIFQLGRKLHTLVLNDNKIATLPVKIGSLVNLETLLLHQNMIVDVPSSLYRL